MKVWKTLIMPTRGGESVTFNPMMEKCVHRLPAGKSVCEFGNQTYTGTGGFTSTKAFYESAGYDDYIAIDRNTEMDAIVADLNKAVVVEFVKEGTCEWKRFDLVTNNGTGEHIFSQALVFLNAHNLCKEGGIMLHVLPFSRWINHGFYNYNPILFRDLAAACGYDIIFRSIGDRWGTEFEISDEELYKEKHPLMLEKIARESQYDLFCIFAFRHNGGRFKNPIQGKYNARYYT